MTILDTVLRLHRWQLDERRRYLTELESLGYSAAQSVVLMALVIALTAVQFRFAEKKVTY